MFVDTHCHLSLLHFTEEQQQNFDRAIDDVVKNAELAGVSKMMSISISLADAPVLAKITQRHQSVGYSIGVHPCASQEELQQASVENLVKLGQAEKVWALGETGLDYYHSTELVAEQKQSFIHHIEASKILKKPIVVHTRSAKEDTVAMIKSEQSRHGILHCFTEDWATAKAVLDCGYYVSFSGIISFKNAQDLRDVAKKVPLDRLLIETDSPYLAPVPYRGKSNEPKYVPFVAQVLADIHQKTIEEMAEITSRNFQQLLAQEL